MDFSGWFVNQNTSNDWDVNLFSTALAAAINLTDTSTHGYGFEAVYENVSVRTIHHSWKNPINLFSFLEFQYLFQYSSK